MDPSGRMLKLLSLLQARPNWTGPELSSRLAVTDRTLRRDVTRLRDLGYPVEALSGPAGGYQLAPGGALPPLLFDDGEAVTVALSLRSAAAGGLPGFEDAAVAALAKIEQVLPKRLAERLGSLQSSIVGLSHRGDPGVALEPETLVNLAQACRRQERLAISLRRWRRQRHRTPRRAVSTRSHLAALVSGGPGPRPGGMAHVPGRPDRPTFSRPGSASCSTTHRTPRALVAEGVAVSAYKIKARVLAQGPIGSGATNGLSDRSGSSNADGEARCFESGQTTSGGSRAIWPASTARFRILDPPELKEAVAALGARLIKNSI